MLFEWIERVWSRTFFELGILIQNFGKIVATIGVFVALAFSALSLVSTSMQTLPVVFTLFGVLSLKGKIAIERIGAVAVAFVVVLIIIRPGIGVSIFLH